MKVVWDSDKAAANPKKHGGVTFEEAKDVLFDPFALTYEDLSANGEQRFVTLGMSAKGRILTVIFTYPKETTIRLIAAWKANKPQRRRYEEQFR